MSKTPGQKMKLLLLAKIFYEQTDESQAYSVAELIDLLAENGIHTGRKSLYDDIAVLSSLGMDIIKEKGDKTRYYMASRQFELAELKLLVDAIQSSKFITAKKSDQLIEKLGKLAGPGGAKSLRRQVYITGETKSHNESVYYSIDSLHSALSSGRQITFLYYNWNLDFSGGDCKIKRQYRREGNRYSVSPWALMWDSEYYYLVAYDTLHREIRHYRVDKMTDISLTELPREGADEYEKISITDYSKQVFSMFSGSEETVRIRFAYRLIGVVVDRFGQDVFVTPLDDGFFCATIKAAVSDQFFAWVFSFGREAQILFPEHVAEKMRDKATEVAKLYVET